MRVVGVAEPSGQAFSKVKGSDGVGVGVSRGVVIAMLMIAVGSNWDQAKHRRRGPKPRVFEVERPLVAAGHDWVRSHEFKPERPSPQPSEKRHFDSRGRTR